MKIINIRNNQGEQHDNSQQPLPTKSLWGIAFIGKTAGKL